MPSARLNTIALYEALDAQRAMRDLNWNEVAEQSGLSPSLMTRLGQGHAPSSHVLAALLDWLGYRYFWITKPESYTIPPVEQPDI